FTVASSSKYGFTRSLPRRGGQGWSEVRIVLHTASTQIDLGCLIGRRRALADSKSAIDCRISARGLQEDTYVPQASANGSRRIFVLQKRNSRTLASSRSVRDSYGHAARVLDITGTLFAPRFRRDSFDSILSAL